MLHKSVLLNESIYNLNIKDGGLYVDMTLGYAGHSKEILKRNKKGFLFAFDKDIDAINHSSKVLDEIGDNYKIFNTGFINIKKCLQDEGIDKVDGILYDLGISSPEIDQDSRGFSYMKDARLDMRMKQDSELSAYEVVNNYKVEDLARIFREYGEEKHALRIAKEIEKQRSIKEITTTLELVDIIDRCIPYKEKRNGHPAKKVFQAIRIEVNNELEEFETSLRDSLSLLNVGGRICVITFHSLEDKICKRIFKEVSDVDELVKGNPFIEDDHLPDFKLITKKPILPTSSELEYNSRAKSAKLRVIERIK